ncbi:hypothetical protein GDO81_013462 [Engystomops pustulosus]|uniref:Uncharacterized protein n=1 Tax=Engystomops pustulosus TaxID=76066 RepID=A0AAV7B0L1_ENGPU|nr:hypothetical protein GDO81_013462 [Engystomops pustulosus]
MKAGDLGAVIHLRGELGRPLTNMYTTCPSQYFTEELPQDPGGKGSLSISDMFYPSKHITTYQPLLTPRQGILPILIPYQLEAEHTNK